LAETEEPSLCEICSHIGDPAKLNCPEDYGSFVLSTNLPFDNQRAVRSCAEGFSLGWQDLCPFAAAISFVFTLGGCSGTAARSAPRMLSTSRAAQQVSTSDCTGPFARTVVDCSLCNVLPLSGDCG